MSVSCGRWRSAIPYVASADALVATILLGLWLIRASFGDDSAKLRTIDHDVRVRSTVPAISRMLRLGY